MKSALLFVLLSLVSFDIQSQTRRLPANGRPAIRSATPESRKPKSAAGTRASQVNLPIRRVILYSNGVAYIERRGIVSNHAEVSLSFKQSQVDDVLKSMVVLDLGKGRIGAVSYNSSAPPSSRMAEIPFAISAATDGNNGGGLAGVLSQLQGARVVVTTTNRTVIGSVLTVEGRHAQIDADKPPVTTHRLVIASDEGALTAFDLADVRTVQLADEGSRRDLSEFAHAAAAARRRDAKTIVVTSEGNGKRELVVSYIVAAPIWKTTYRVLLDPTGKPFFQGWAIVDNVSEEDWNGIELSLVSGTPVSFIQPIQNPVYRYRPVVPLQDDLNLKPQTYEPGEDSGGAGSLTGTITDASGGVIPGAAVTIMNDSTQQSFEVTTDSQGLYRAQNLPAGVYTINVSVTGFKKFTGTNLNVRPGTRSKYNPHLEAGSISEVVTVTAAEEDVTARQVSELPLQGRNYAGLLALNPGVGGGRGAGGGGRRETLSNLISRRESGVEAETTSSEVGDLFEYRIDQPVTVPRDRSALIPILQTRMEGERVSIFNENSQAHRPMSGMLLKNTSSLTLEDGSLTVIDGDSYAGEALLERLKPEEERLISYAVDLGTLVNVSSEDGDREPTFLVRAVNGVIEAHYYDTRKKVYTLVNQTDHPRVVYLEHPLDEDEEWELTDETEQPVTKTANHYRFRVSLEPHQKREFPVVERSEQIDSYQLSGFTRRELELFIARKYVDENTRAALEVIIALKDKVAGAEARLQEVSKEVGEITQDQQRLRENIRAMSGTSIGSAKDSSDLAGAEAKKLIARYFVKANEQETRLEQLEKDRRLLVDEHSRLQAELGSAIRGLSLDRKLK
ncbi:MAG TPA: hypothetical protein DCK99_03860 [Blastocatellia bacterium]|nr:hypothetical protein [Blastocatellia bacterium]